MKKNVLYTLMMLFATISFTSCSDEQGTEPGNDSKPVATVFTYNAEVPNDPDVDCSLRIATNSATKEVYYLAQKQADYEALLTSSGESGVIEKVIANGTAVTPNADAATDVILKNLGGTYTIAVVAVNGNTKTLSTGEFTGYNWVDVVSGTYYSQYTNAESIFGWTEKATTMQYKEADPTQYRFKDLFGQASHLLFNKTSYTTDGGVLVTVPAQTTPFSYGSYGSLFVRDVATWQGDDSYLAYNILGDDNSCQLWLQWYVSAGNTGYKLDYFVPAE